MAMTIISRRYGYPSYHQTYKCGINVADGHNDMTSPSASEPS